jgi:hypothetical protein
MTTKGKLKWTTHNTWTTLETALSANDMTFVQDVTRKRSSTLITSSTQCRVLPNSFASILITILVDQPILEDSFSNIENSTLSIE